MNVHEPPIASGIYETSANSGSGSVQVTPCWIPVELVRKSSTGDILDAIIGLQAGMLLKDILERRSEKDRIPRVVFVATGWDGIA